MEQAYASALWHMVQAGEEPSKAVRALHEVLQKQGRGELMHRIGRAFERIAQRESRKSTLVLTLAHKKDEHRAAEEVKKILREMNLDAARIETAVDDSLIGGWRLEGRGTLIDNSYKKHLIEMYNRATS